jgi:hypothetical protein
MTFSRIKKFVALFSRWRIAQSLSVVAAVGLLACFVAPANAQHLTGATVHAVSTVSPHIPDEVVVYRGVKYNGVLQVRPAPVVYNYPIRARRYYHRPLRLRATRKVYRIR